MVRLLWGFWWCLPGLLHGGAAAAAFLPFSAEGIFRAFGSLVEPSQVSGGGGGGRRRGQRDEPAQGIALSDKGGAGGRAGWRMSWPLFRDFSAAPPLPNLFTLHSPPICAAPHMPVIMAGGGAFQEPPNSSVSSVFQESGLGPGCPPALPLAALSFQRPARLHKAPPGL